MIKDYKQLVVWQKAMELVVEVYSIVKLLPKEEQYAIANQMRRAAISIPSNIAEGNSRNTTKEYIQFLYISLGSKAEVETLVEISKRLGYINDSSNIDDLCNEVGKLINAIISKLTPSP